MAFESLLLSCIFFDLIIAADRFRAIRRALFYQPARDF
jgi:hypothetical protein